MSPPPRRKGPSKDPSVEHEPHLRGDGFQADPSEAKVEKKIRPEKPDDQIDHNVWEEPTLFPAEHVELPASAITYERWLTEHLDRTSPAQRQWNTLLIALAAGPFAILGAMLNGVELEYMFFTVLVVAVIGPAIEETMKIALATWVVEKRPFLFGSGRHILFCGAVSGFVFAAVENVLYLNVYIPNPTDNLVLWRWTVCVALHTGCSFLASVGLARVWREATTTRKRPRIGRALPYLIMAIVIHGLYNGSAVLLAAFGFDF